MTLLRLLYFVLCLGSLPALADNTYLLELQSQAKTLSLASQPMWLNLLHFKQHPITGQPRSLADDPGFFASTEGASQPAAELDATLEAFFTPERRFGLNQSARCRFPARYDWLAKQLQWDESRIPAADCSRYAAWRQSLDADSVTLVFPAAYVNSPASMYGHTFLRINPAGANQAHPLLSYAISYAADTPEDAGFLFAIKGLAGFYPGVFTNSPYYLKIREYTHLENRDIWEYDLQLSREEIDRLLAHTWELGITRFDYFFFDENCSYHLLSLLDVARPSLALTDHFQWWAIPVDTVRAVVDTPGLLTGRHYRPSNSSELNWLSSTLPRSAREAAIKLADPTVALTMENKVPDTLSIDEQARTLDLAERYLAYQAARGVVGNDETQRRRIQLLQRRAALETRETPAMPMPSTPPELGHRTGRVGLMGMGRNGQSVMQLDLRPAYHDLLDPEAGFSRGAQIQFFDIGLEQQAGERWSVQRIIPVDIASVTPGSLLFNGMSWRVRFGLERPWAEPGSPLAFSLRGGPGLAWEWGSTGRLMTYGFLDHQLWRDHSLRQPFALSVGLAAGMIWDPLSTTRIKLDWQARQGVGTSPNESGLELQLRQSLDRNNNLVGQCAYRKRTGNALSDNLSRQCGLGWQRYW